MNLLHTHVLLNIAVYLITYAIIEPKNLSYREKEHCNCYKRVTTFMGIKRGCFITKVSPFTCGITVVRTINFMYS